MSQTKMQHRVMGKKSIILLGLFLFAIFVTPVHAKGKKTPFPPQERLGVSVAQACEGFLIGYARNPSLRMMLEEIYDGAIEKMGALRKSRVRKDLSEAIGIIEGARIVAMARNPSLEWI